MHGLHLTADLHGCPAQQAAMTDPAALRACCLAAVRAAGLTPVGELFHRFEAAAQTHSASGITGVLLLAESHLAVHTWPELCAVTIDVYVCNFQGDNSQRAQVALESLIGTFGATQVLRQSLQRGAVPAGAMRRI